MGGDFVYGLINSLDGERDPRNLDFIFSFMPDFLSNFSLQHLSEEMFEIFACYFPIDFNPNKSDPDTITRDALAVKLSNCLVACPEFAEWVIPLALEKLESDLVVAKLDSLQLISQAALKFSPEIMQTHFEIIWTALKTEIYPGSDTGEVISAGLRVLHNLLERAGKMETISHNYQTCILGTILSHVCEINERLYNPSISIALVCVAGDAAFAGQKILNSFLLKLQAAECTDEQRLKFYLNIAAIYQISAQTENVLEKLAKQEVSYTAKCFKTAYV